MQEGAEAWAITFERNPASILNPHGYLGDLQTLRTKLDGFRSMGLDGTLVLPFDTEFQQLDAKAFLESLTEGLRVERLVVGANFRLGRYPGTDAAHLQSEHRGLRVDIVDLATDNGGPISSSRIRDAVASGRLFEAEALLGSAYRLDVQGIPILRHGKTFGIWREWTQQVLPKTGVFTLKALVDGKDVKLLGSFNKQGLFWDMLETGSLQSLEFLPEG